MTCLIGFCGDKDSSEPSSEIGDLDGLELERGERRFVDVLRDLFDSCDGIISSMSVVAH